jgi:hypothetical protein
MLLHAWNTSSAFKGKIGGSKENSSKFPEGHNIISQIYLTSECKILVPGTEIQGVGHENIQSQTCKIIGTT